MKRRNFLGLGAAVLAAPTVLLAESEQGYVSRKLKPVEFVSYPVNPAPLFGELTSMWFAGLAEKDFRLCALYVKRGTKTLMSFGANNAFGARTFWNAGPDGGLMFSGEELPIIEVIGTGIEWGYGMKRSDNWNVSVTSRNNEKPFVLKWGH